MSVCNWILYSITEYKYRKFPFISHGLYTGVGGGGIFLPQSKGASFKRGFQPFKNDWIINKYFSNMPNSSSRFK